MSFNIQSLQIATIPLSRIDWESTTFSLRCEREKDAVLRDSIGRSGIHNPPLLRSVSEQLEIVYGFGRLRVQRENGIDEVLVRIAPEDTQVSELLLAAIEDNLCGGRALNCIEKAMAIEKLGAFMDDAALIRDVLPLLGYGPSPKMLIRLRSFRQLPTSAQSAMARGDLAEGLAEHFEPFSDEECEQAVACILRLRLSQGAARDMLRQAYETCRRDDIGLLALFRSLAFDPATEIDPKALPQYRAEFMDALLHRRSPILTGLEDDYAEKRMALRLPDTIRLHPPKNFEGNLYRLEARITSIKDLETVAKTLADRLREQRDLLDAMLNVRIRPERKKG